MHRSFGQQERELRKQQRADLRNYLKSISLDAEFVQSVAAYYARLPLWANLRNGLWLSPEYAGAAYFKSADGHQGRWTFSVTRLNAHFAASAMGHGGCVLVDSTRRGKQFPDSFTRTVPIWCAVINKLLGLSDAPHGELHMPDSISASEADQVRQKVDGWAAGAMSTARILRKQLLQITGGQDSWLPFRPVWVSTILALYGDERRCLTNKLAR
jgi:tRNA A64-2'-O-ribosylphosphate transferase